MPIIFSSRMIANVPTSGSNGSKNWHPGNYAKPDQQGYPFKDTLYDGCIGLINDHPSANGIAGILLQVPWARVENAEDVYTWTWLDDRIDLVTENGANSKQVILNTSWTDYGTSTTPTTPQDADFAVVPDYIIDAGWCADGDGIMPRIDITGCRDRVIALAQALFDRYGNNPRIEMIVIGETDRTTPDVNNTNLAAAWIYIAEALVPMSAGKLAWAGIDHNGLPTNPYASNIDLQDVMDNGGIAMSNPDIIGFYGDSSTPPGVSFDENTDASILAQSNHGYSTYRGYTFTNSDNTDRREWTPSKPEFQVIRPDDLTPAKVKWYADNWFKATHTTWTIYAGTSHGTAYYYNTSDDFPGTEFDSYNLLTYIGTSGNGPARTSYPTGGP